MTEEPLVDNDHAEVEKSVDLKNMHQIAREIHSERPQYVYVADQHITGEPQEVAASLLRSLASDPSYKPGDVGFYAEALYDTASPAAGDLSGDVVRWDDYDATRTRPTKYRETIRASVELGIPTHGIDINKRVDGESEERMQHWVKAIDRGSEPIKILLVGGGHLWNDKRFSSDMITRLEGEQWILLNEQAYVPPGSAEIKTADISAAVDTDRKYKVVKYGSKQT